ncbi:MAG: metal ABC transporter permease [Candidatus Competibacterales bacterium]
MNELWTLLTLQGGYNSAVVCSGAALLGAGGGVVGSFALLRKRAMVSDAVSHGTLPGVTAAFILGALFWGDGKQLSLLLLGAGVSAALSVVLVQAIARHTRLPEDAAIATVLSVFYGLGMVLLSAIQSMPTGGQAGLEDYLLGSTAGMLRSEAEFIGLAALTVTGIAVLFFKEFGLLCFDPAYAAARGWRVAALDLFMLSLMVAIVVIGLKTVGLVLIIAIVIIPPVAARLWTERLQAMVVIAAAIGATGGYLGAALSATAPRLPSGGVIVLTLAALFVVSLLVAPARGLLAATVRQLRTRWILAERQGLLALAVGQQPTTVLGKWLLRAKGHLAGAGRATAKGLACARRTRRDQVLWDRLWRDYPEEALRLEAFALVPIERALPADLVDHLERRVRADTPDLLASGPLPAAG